MTFDKIKNFTFQDMTCTGCGKVFDVKTADLDSGKVNAFTLCEHCNSKQARFNFK